MVDSEHVGPDEPGARAAPDTDLDHLPLLLTAKQAAEALNRSVFTIRGWVRSGRIRIAAASSVRDYRIPRTEVERLLAPVPPPPSPPQEASADAEGVGAIEQHGRKPGR